jgi:hypothetical protein
MQLDYPRRTRRRPQVWLQLTLLIGFLFCLVLGVGALAALVVVQTEPPAQESTSPFAAVARSQIVPQHALMQLTGDPADALAYQALAAGELDLAYTVALFTPDLSDARRLALFTQLGTRYLAGDRPDDARKAYALARSTAILGRGLTTLERSQALLQIANGQLDAEAQAAALDTAVQAKRLATQTPELLPAQRSQIFENLAAPAQRLDDPAFAQEVHDLARNPYLTPQGQVISSRWISLTEAVAPDPAVDAALTTRRQAARVLADRILLTGGIDIDPERQTLASALLAEDQARAAAFQRALSAGLSLPQQFYLLQERRAWLALKARIALGGFGMTIVPEWEQNAPAIVQELGGATNNVASVVEGIIGTLADPVAQAMLRVEALTWLAQQLELGMLPNVTPTQLSDQLRVAQSELTRLGAPLALPVAHDRNATPPGFRYVAPEALQ